MRLMILGILLSKKLLKSVFSFLINHQIPKPCFVTLKFGPITYQIIIVLIKKIVDMMGDDDNDNEITNNNDDGIGCRKISSIIIEIC